MNERWWGKKSSKKITYVCGNGCVKTGGNLTGSLGLGAAAAAAGLAAFDSAAGGADFFGADDSDAVGFGAVIDGSGGDATPDDELPICNHSKTKYLNIWKFKKKIGKVPTFDRCRLFSWLLFIAKVTNNRVFDTYHFLCCIVDWFWSFADGIALFLQHNFQHWVGSRNGID